MQLANGISTELTQAYGSKTELFPQQREVKSSKTVLHHNGRVRQSLMEMVGLELCLEERERKTVWETGEAWSLKRHGSLSG